MLQSTSGDVPEIHEQSLVSFLKDRIGRGSPDKWAGLAIVVLNEFLDPPDQFTNTAKATPTDGLLGNKAEPAFDLVEPGVEYVGV